MKVFAKLGGASQGLASGLRGWRLRAWRCWPRCCSPVFLLADWPPRRMRRTTAQPKDAQGAATAESPPAATDEAASPVSTEAVSEPDAPAAIEPEQPVQPPHVHDASAAPRGPTSVEDLAAFLDGVMAVHLKDKHIAGATIAVVVDKKPFFSKGYGFADVATKKPVNPDDTMFRIASVSKLFTWTAVMQLAEQGKLDLDADINKYLTEFKVPETFPQPITLKHLMTHTPGFEDQVIGLFAHSPDELAPLGEVLRASCRRGCELQASWPPIRIMARHWPAISCRK